MKKTRNRQRCCVECLESRQLMSAPVTGSTFANLAVAMPAVTAPVAITSPTAPTNVKATATRVSLSGVSTPAFKLTFTAGKVPAGYKLDGYQVNIIFNNKVFSTVKIGAVTSITIACPRMVKGKVYYMQLMTVAKSTTSNNTMTSGVSTGMGGWITST